MNDDFQPPIKSRSTEDLLLIVGSPKKWNPKALHLAQQELYLRKIDSAKIDQAKYLAAKLEKIETQRIANTSFNFFSINPFDLFINWQEVLIFLFSWELEKDGFIRKYEFQRKYRPIVFFITLMLIIYSFIFKSALCFL